METSSKARASMRRSSMPSKRPASSSAPGPAASSRTMAWPPPGGRKIGGRGIGVADAGMIDGGGKDVRTQDHAGAPARGRVVDGPVTAEPELADVDGIERPDPALQRLARQRGREWTRK